MKTLTRLIAVVLLCTITSTSLWGQELHFYTKVYDLSSKAKKPPVIARSLSLFHAGKVYDYVESIGEVTIFEPVKNRFLILDTKRDILTVADLDEIKHHLKVAHQVTEDHIQKLQQRKYNHQKDEQDAMQVAKHLTFQLKPTFQIEHDTASNRITLKGTGIQYIASSAKNDSKEVVNAFLKYTDWTARLNYVLHPGAVFPASRIVLNEQLKKHQSIPTSVELKTDKVHLSAEHQVHWNLDARDRSLIHRWNQQLKSKSIKKVTLREYQRITLTSK